MNIHPSDQLLIGETLSRPKGDRVPINIAESVREDLRNLLYQSELRGVGYSEFIQRAVELAWREIHER